MSPSRASVWRANDDVIAFGDLVVDHRVAFDPQAEVVVGVEQTAEIDAFFLLEGEQGLTSRDVPRRGIAVRGCGGSES